MFEDVSDFHRKFGLPFYGDGGPPRLLDDDAFAFRDKFMQEELDEIREAHAAGDLAAFADGLVDLAYVVLGTAHMAGVPFDRVWAEVHRANMEKVRATSADQSKRGSTLDVVKPDGWTPPDVEGALRG